MSKKLDVLDREAFIDQLKNLVKIISENKQGCCFGLNGLWGSGKSFVLEKFEEEIKKMQSEETSDNRYFVFHYDCWKYDYYEEPAIAIIAALLDATDRELHVFTSEQRDVAKKAAWETTKETLKAVASELCKNKVGIDLVEIAANTIKDRMKEEDNSFDSLYGFKRALEATRKGIQEIADRKTVIIIVDELDRCLPEYTIKVLERLHHMFTELKNVIVIVSMDKAQIEHSIKEIYGEINVDTYLRKFISFKINLDNGRAGQYIRKYETYTSMFEFLQGEEEVVEKFFSDIMAGLDIRTQERIFNKAETIHKLICSKEIKDSSIMTFEILFLT
ncbi:MAG: KAP family NTPase, partial [Bacteroides fragilis]|nr:KAP family NTPase [Bacteroides fragilis]